MPKIPVGVWVSLFALFTASAGAQMRGGGMGRGGPTRGGVTPGAYGARGSLRPAHPTVGGRIFSGRGPGYGAGYYVPYGYGFLDPLNYAYYGAPEPQVVAQAPEPNVIVIAPPAPPTDLQRPPADAGPVILEVAAPSNTGARSDAPLPPIEIVLKDGTVRQAIGIVVVSKMLKYVDLDGQNLQIPLDDIDRTATRRINRQRNLTLWLP